MWSSSFNYFRQRQPWLSTLRFALIRVFILLIFLILNPFDLASRSGETSRTIWQHMFAETYLDTSYRAGDDRNGEPTGRRDITVLLLGEADMAALAGGADLDAFAFWDLIDRVRFAAAAENIANPPPKAIFVDFGLGRLAPEGIGAEQMVALTDDEKRECEKGRGANPPSAFRCFLYLTGTITGYEKWGKDPTCQVDPVAKLKCIMEARAIPVIFADTQGPSKSANPSTVEGFRALATIGLISRVHFSQTDRYELVDPKDTAARDKANFRLSPAALLFAIDCVDKAMTDKACRPFPVANRGIGMHVPSWAKGSWTWQDDFSEPVDIIWGIGAPSEFTRAREGISESTLAQDCQAAEGWWGAAKSFGRLMFNGLNIATQDRCFYTRTLTYQQMEDGSPELLKSAFAEKLVLIGQSSSQAGDFVEAPIFGQVPGVLLHAMATDNLIVRGGSYPRSSAQIFGFDFRMQDFNNLLALFLTLIPIGLARLHIKFVDYNFPLATRGRARFWGHRFGVIALLMLFSLMLITLMTGQLSPIPLYHNFAVLTIVIAFEMIRFYGLILRPVMQSWIDKYPRVSALYSEALEPHFGITERNSNGE